MICSMPGLPVHHQLPEFTQTHIHTYIYIMEYYSAIKRNEFESAIVRLMNLEPVIQIEVTKRKTNIVY